LIRPLARRAAIESAIIAAVLSPVPFADELALVPYYGLLGARVARRRELAVAKVPWRPMAVSVGKGLAARGVVSFGISFIPGVDAVVNAVSAATLTEVLTQHFDEACADPKHAEPLAFQHLVEVLSSRRAAHEAHKTRVRVPVPGLLGDRRYASRVEETLESLPSVRHAEANVHSGRVLVLTNCEWGDARAEVEAALREISPLDAVPPLSLQRSMHAVRRRALRALRRVSRTVRHQPSTTESHAGPARAPWYAMDTNKVVKALSAHPSHGLTSEAAQERTAKYGANLLSGMKRRSEWEILAGELFNLPMALLAGGALLSAAAGDLLEAGAIILVLGSNVAIGYFTESRAEELLGAWGRLRAEWATAIRDGHEIRLKASDLVPGDVVILKAGTTVAADARILTTDECTLDESMLTGESEPVEKSPTSVLESAALADRSSMLYAGTIVASGRCKAVVVATGNFTELGNLQRSLSHAEERTAPLERQLGALGRTLALLSLGCTAVVTGLGAVRGQPPSVLLRNAVALGVAAIPEGFAAVGTTALALASQRLQKRGIIIRRLAAAETLGAVGVVCADKTGTLTENRMRVAEVLLQQHGLAAVQWSDGKLRMQSSTGAAVPSEAVRDLARIAALNADVEISRSGEITQASGTERALVDFALAAGYPVRARRRAAKRIGERRRSAESPIMVTIHEHPELGRIELAKGAPEEVVPRCTDLGAKEIARILGENEAMASRGLRVLGLAWRSDLGRPLQFAGLVGLRDPPRPHVREAIETLAGAGVRTLMLTGDQQRTAAAIGGVLGIEEGAVYSRVTPDAKLGIVQDLQRRGEIVAMTGDGVNDGPALKAADVGIAMGERGTDLARAVADVVLAHDDLSSLARATAEGRTLYDNVRRSIDYMVATNLSEVAVMLLGSLVGITPLSPLHLLWINVMTDVAPALALAVEPPERDVMTRPPRDPSASLFGRADSRRLGRRSAQLAAGAMASYAFGALHGNGIGGPYASTMTFTSLVTSQLLETRNHRSASGMHDPWLGAVLVSSFAVQGASLAHPEVRSVLGNASLRLYDLVFSVASGIVAARLGGRPFFVLAPSDEVVGVRRIHS
jgi:Ca2+-transporting ATPase